MILASLNSVASISTIIGTAILLAGVVFGSARWAKQSVVTDVMAEMKGNGGNTKTTGDGIVRIEKKVDDGVALLGLAIAGVQVKADAAYGESKETRAILDEHIRLYERRERV